MTTTRKLSPRQRKRMAAIVVEFQKYVATYSDQQCYQDYSDRTFIEDMLYGIGVAIDRERFRAADG
ncbi:hypothetical protein, partial [Escherichia coli]|uniref:hypothetical protein n=1 Tax=Escherichia coli TaxID=562 RepID=UPI003EC7B871